MARIRCNFTYDAYYGKIQLTMTFFSKVFSYNRLSSARLIIWSFFKDEIKLDNQNQILLESELHHDLISGRQNTRVSYQNQWLHEAWKTSQKLITVLYFLERSDKHSLFIQRIIRWKGYQSSEIYWSEERDFLTLCLNGFLSS